MKIALVTAIFGAIDNPKPLPLQIGCAACDHILVTPASSTSEPRMQARFFKMKAHEAFPGYDVFIWVDGNIQIKSAGFVAGILNALEGNDIAISAHSARTCIYEEAAFIANGIENGSSYLRARYQAKDVLDESEAYRATGHPEGYGLYWCGLFARRVSPQLNAFFDQWWEHSSRWPRSIDQISFPYLARKLNIKIGLMDWGSYYDNPSYKLVPHSKLQ